MNVCLIHIRLTIAPGSSVPALHFQSDLESEEDNLRKVSYSTLAEFHASDLAGMDVSSISPMKPSKTKAEQPDDIDLEKMTEAQKSEVSTKLMGQRKFRKIHIETFHRSSEGVSAESKSAESGSSTSAKSDVSHNLKAPLKEKFRGESSDRNIQQVISDTTKELLKRSSNSHSSNKDDEELSEILQMSASVTEAAESSPSSSAGRHTPSSRMSSDSQQRATPTSQTTNLPFFSGNPAVGITHGIIHLYKTNYMVQVDDDLRPPPTTMLCMLAVPASVDAHSILEFTSGFCDTIKRLQIIRDRTPNQYMVLMLFVSKKAATNFYRQYNGAQFSSLSQEVCRLAFVASVEALPSVHDSSRPPAEARGFMPIPDSTELPDCVLCLERMDESVRGVLTILCSHSFHGSCLQKWEDLCCPVCRYLQTPEPETDNRCLVCGSLEDLWICLICGHVGCGRYTSEHAKQHYMETHHNYAMALIDNRVWDYAGDYFVHRLFQNKEDGKLVEQKGPDGDLREREAKIEAIQLECMYLLTSQLDSQRKHWEERLAKVEEMAQTDRRAATTQLSETVSKLEFVEKEKMVLEKKNQQLASKFTSSLRDLATERELNNGLRKNQDEWRAKVKSMEASMASQQSEIAELKDQVRDLMFFLEAQKTVDGADEETREEIQSGQIVVGATSGGQKKKRKSKGK